MGVTFKPGWLQKSLDAAAEMPAWMTDPLPLRNCSNCENWHREYVTTHEDGRQKAPCGVHNALKYGSETCSKWVRR